MNDSDRDALLIRVDERVCHLTKVVANHLAQHWSVTLLAVGAVLTAIAAVIVGLVK